MSDLLLRLKVNQRRGSKPRCHLLTHGRPEQVAERLTALITPWGSVAPTDRWIPAGFDRLAEAQLHTATDLLDPAVCDTLCRWWLPEDRLDARTPNWDIAATCTIKGLPGLLLVEAKAHDKELLNEAAGRKRETKEKGDQAARAASHVTIGTAIDEARAGLRSATGLPWHISRDSHYQPSNRCAWSWKLADVGVAVVLVYLGFLNASEMAKDGVPFANAGEWESLVKGHCASLFAASVWNREWVVNGVPFVPLIRAIEQPLNGESPR